MYLRDFKDFGFIGKVGWGGMWRLWARDFEFLGRYVDVLVFFF